jgi:hypothetical protein
MNDIHKLWNENKLASAKAKANFNLLTNCNWKVGDEITCIDNMGKFFDLTVGKKYIIDKIYKECGLYHVDVLGDEIHISGLFCSRFTTLKLERLKKLNKLKEYENFKKK